MFLASWFFSWALGPCFPVHPPEYLSEHIQNRKKDSSFAESILSMDVVAIFLVP